MSETKEKTPEEVADGVKTQLTKYGLKPTEKVTVTDPLTGVTREISLDRTGTSEQKLIMALADPDLNRERKDFVLSMYLYERGKESASMIVDLMRYKGEHTKETRAFKSQMRFDFEIFVSQFSKYIRNQARLIGITLKIDIGKERNDFANWLKKMSDLDREEKRPQIERTYSDYMVYMNSKLDLETIALIEMAIHSEEEGERFVQQMQNVTKAREREKGKGIYVDRNGRITTYDDPDLDEIIKADREREEELKHEE